MEFHTRTEYLDCLQGDWKALPARYSALSPEGRQAYLKKQGYTSLAGLLGHVVAWWSEAERVIHLTRRDPTFPPPDYAVDEFNATAVERFGALTDEVVLQIYESQLRKMISLVIDLSEAEFRHPSINRRLFYETLGHWTEHSLK